jgi:hypothetical protein
LVNGTTGRLSQSTSLVLLRARNASGYFGHRIAYGRIHSLLEGTPKVLENQTSDFANTVFDRFG